MNAEALGNEILKRASGKKRFMAAVVGAPASGKTTLAEQTCTHLNRSKAGTAAVVPMDGYHLDNCVLDKLGLRARKGAPETFDAHGFGAMLARLRMAERDVAIPVFDRSADLARACAEIVSKDTSIILVEGNYLLLNAEPWKHCEKLFDFTIFLEVPEEVLFERLINRWTGYGHSVEEARQRALANDIPNARLVSSHSLMADMIVENS